MRDQLFDHRLGAAGYYLNQDVEVDTRALFLGRPSDETVQHMARHVGLTADPNAPIELSEDQKNALRRHPKVVRLQQKAQQLAAKLRAQGYRPIKTAEGTPLYNEQRKAQKQLDSLKVRLRNKTKDKARQKWFRNADTIAFDAQFLEARPTPDRSPDKAKPSRKYSIPERAEVLQWIDQAPANATEQEQLSRRIKGIEAMARLCRRQETRREVELASPENSDDPELSCGSLEPEVKREAAEFPLVCMPRQCIFCLGDPRKTYDARTFQYTRTNKMLDEVEKHLSRFGPHDPVACPHPICQTTGLILPNIKTFKNHVKTVHEIDLRVCSRCIPT